MKRGNIKIGRVYRMKGRKSDRRVIDIVECTAIIAGDIATYQMAVVEIVGGSGRRFKEYLPWLADDAIGEVTAR